MKGSKLIPLIVVTIVFSAMAMLIANQRAPETELKKMAVFPQLLEQLNDVSRITVINENGESHIVRNDDTWVVENRDNYPAIFEAVKATVVSVAKLQILEGKTSNPDRYERLHVEGTKNKPGKSTLLTLADANGQTLAQLVIGKIRTAPANAPAQAALYIRAGNDPKALLVEGQLDIASRPVDWVKKDLFTIAADRITHIKVTHNGISYTLSRDAVEKKNFKLAPIHEGYIIKSQASINGMGAALEEVRFRDVKTFDGQQDTSSAFMTEYTTFDGLITTVSIIPSDNDKGAYAHFVFSTTESAENASKAEANQLNKQHQLWSYALPEFKYQMMTKTLADQTRVKPEEKKK